MGFLNGRAAALALLVTGCSEGHLDAFVEQDAVVADGGANSDGGAVGRDAQATGPRLIDDFEDGDTQALYPPGWWYVFRDDTEGAQAWAIQESDTGGLALHTWGGGFTAWGAGVGVDLRQEGDNFDASAFGELRFRARAEPGFEQTLSVHLLEANTTHFVLEVELSAQWTQYRIRFDQATAGDDRRLNPRALSAVQLFVGLEPFDLWLDDFYFAPVN